MCLEANRYTIKTVMGTLNAYRRRSGFTIVELIVVISVIAILAAILIVSMGAWQRSVRTSVVKSDLNAVAAAMEVSRNSSTGYPLTIPSTFAPSADVTFPTPTLMTLTEFCIDARSTPDPTIQYYIYSKTKDQGPLEGTCATRPDLTLPVAPASVGVLSTDSVTVTVSWASVADAVSYIAQCATDAAFIYNPKQITVAAGSGTIQGVITGITASSSPFCRVKAINAKGSSTWSPMATATGTNDGLIAQWTFNGNANDVVGSAEGTVSGATLTAGESGTANTAYSFNGSSSYITVPRNMYTNPMTISAWYKATNATSGSGIIAYGNVSSGDGYGSNEEFHIGQSTSNYAAYLNVAGCTSGTLTIGTIPNTGWHLLTFALGPGSAYATYIDGTPAISGSIGCSPNFSTYQSTFLFGRPNAATRFLDGAVDDVRIYNRALTPGEVLNLYTLRAE